MRSLPRPGPLELKDLLGAALRATARAAGEILAVYAGAFSVQAKQDDSPITEADRRAHRVILEELRRGGPHPILSEEGRLPPYVERRRWPAYWLVDPLDGTKEFVKRNGEFTVNIALIALRQPVLGVVYAPVLGLLYFAARGLGAFRAEGVDPAARDLLARARPLPRLASVFPGRIPRRRQRIPLTALASRSHPSARWERCLEALRRVYPEVRVIPLGSALKSCFVAEGRADLYLRFGTTMEWDTAAAQAVVEQAGRRVCVYPGRRPLRYNKPSLANPSIIVF